jgi:hypothetical protein
MPLLEFLYSEAKYSQSSLSSLDTQSPGLIVANLSVRYLRVTAWNLFWCDCSLLAAGRVHAVDSAYLQVAQLSELFAAVVELAAEWLDLLVNDLVCSNVATLGKTLSADVTAVWTLPSVSPLVCLP